jgi:hypothetical protein
LVSDVVAVQMEQKARARYRAAICLIFMAADYRSKGHNISGNTFTPCFLPAL